MDPSSELEERFFEEDFLKFNAQRGAYITNYNTGNMTLPGAKTKITHYLQTFPDYDLS